MNIDTIEITGVDAHIAAAARAATQTSLNGKYIGLFSRANTLIYPKNEIVRAVMDTSPEIEHIHVERNGLSSVRIDIQLKRPIAFMCTGLPDFDPASDTSCYVSDMNGVLFRRESIRSMNIPRLYIDAGTTTDMIGSAPVELSRFTSLIDFYERVERAHITVAGLLLSEVHDELYVARNESESINSDTIVVVYVSEKYPLNETFENLVSFWNHMKTASSTTRLSEIKLQFPPNVYYSEIQ